MTKTKTNWTEVINLINDSKTIAVFPHVSADGDGIGSAVALALALKECNKKVTVFLEEKPEDMLEFLIDDTVSTVIGLLDNISESAKFDLSIAVDSSDIKRLGKRQNLYNSATKTIKIDHHLVDNDNKEKQFGDCNVYDTKWAATCEGLYDLICELFLNDNCSETNSGHLLSTEIALRLYTGILTDTGNFAYQNVTGNTHYVASMLVPLIGDISWISRQVFNTRRKNALKIFAIAYNKLEYYNDGTISYVQLTEKEFKKTKTSKEDVGELVSYLREVKGVEVSVFVRPSFHNKKGVKISMRSSDKCDVAKIASSFGGGGHIRAAGADIPKYTKKEKLALIKKIQEAMVE